MRKVENIPPRFGKITLNYVNQNLFKLTSH